MKRVSLESHQYTSIPIGSTVSEIRTPVGAGRERGSSWRPIPTQTSFAKDTDIGDGQIFEKSVT
ncbi:hypothetical protein ZHAS_00021191 [Anopheles sinensis]|uniref:Uncharacterized protein n=1 Tax=Anopheles sinensis TaxID=74873 RepID=A0A084WRR7_ANOSI|nr:hypothetical protein ZHAS_00021191 [Anopheles sinensis]